MKGERTRGQTRERILGAARKLIAAHGLEKAEVRLIAEEAKSSTSRFYEHFDSLNSLLVDVFESGWSLIETAVGRKVLFTALENTDELVRIEEACIGVVDGFLEAFREYPEAVGAAVILSRASIGHESGKRVRDSDSFKSYQRLSGSFVTLFSHHVPEPVARVLVDTIFAGVLRHVSRRTPVYLAYEPDRPEADPKAFRQVMRGLVQGVVAVTRGDAAAQYSGSEPVD